MNESIPLKEGRELLLELVGDAIAVVAERNGRLALMCLDIDNFRDINFSAGYAVGDEVLKQAAERLKSALRDMDRVVRIGDDEFGILLPSILHQDHASLAAHKLLDTLDEHFSVADQEVQVRASIGIAVCPDTATHPEELLRQATIAMCRAKETRIGHTLYSETGATSRMTVSGYMRELQKAIADNDLELYYQPKKNLKTGEICGAEALTRWPHPEHGFISPGEFIPVAEQTGMIRELTFWALNTALRQCAVWKDRQDFVVSVNVSARDLLDPNLPDLIQRSLDTWGVDPSRLTLELTETAMMQDRRNTLTVLNRLSAVGLSLSIDDFGSGYSSLTYLQKLPVDELKIEKDFVVNMQNNESDSIIVRTVVDLGHNFNLSVVAEGVETEEAYDMLAAMGCDIAQGYLIAKPMPAADFEERFRIHRAAVP
ncbi:MAG: bifunctional diguanylate cyclase/phosphodiesterase [Gammaproteobacteria bacterium]|nr:bifunctional diguanylate cyclase/phosphodiesterase [Gammaproteobacteria bacterium]